MQRDIEQSRYSWVILPGVQQRNTLKGTQFGRIVLKSHDSFESVCRGGNDK